MDGIAEYCQFTFHPRRNANFNRGRYLLPGAQSGDRGGGFASVSSSPGVEHLENLLDHHLDPRRRNGH